MKLAVNEVPAEIENNPDMYVKHINNSDSDRLKNHIFVRSNSIIRKVIAFSMDLILNKKFPNIVLTSMSKNMDKSIYIAELIKQKLKGLSQQSALKTLEYEETYIPIKGHTSQEKIVVYRSVPLLEIVLDYKNTIDINHYGYQAPLPEDKLSQENPKEYILKVMNEFKNKKNVYGWKNNDTNYKPKKKWKEPAYEQEQGEYRAKNWGNNDGYKKKKGNYKWRGYTKKYHNSNYQDYNNWNDDDDYYYYPEDDDNYYKPKKTYTNKPNNYKNKTYVKKK